MILAIIKFSNIEGLTTHIRLESSLVHMSLETVCSKPDTFTLGPSLVHVGIGKTTPVSSHEESWAAMHFTF